MKKLGFILRLFVMLSLLQGCYMAPPPSSQPPAPAPAPASYTMEVRTDKNAYRIGEKVVITVRTSQDCYLTLYDISTQGEVTQIFPNQFAADNQIKGGVVYSIPTQTDTFDFLISGPAGMERVRAVGTIENVNLVDARSIDRTEKFPRIRQSSEQFDQGVSQKLETMPRARWTEASITFQVVP